MTSDGVTVFRLEQAIRVLAEALANYRCPQCSGHDGHETCAMPDWVGIGKKMLQEVEGREG